MKPSINTSYNRRNNLKDMGFIKSVGIQGASSTTEMRLTEWGEYVNQASTSGAITLPTQTKYTLCTLSGTTATRTLNVSSLNDGQEGYIIIVNDSTTTVKVTVSGHTKLLGDVDDSGNAFEVPGKEVREVSALRLGSNYLVRVA